MSSPIYRFGDHQVDAAGRELRYCGQPLPLPPKAFDCLVYLIEHRSRAVGRDELGSAVWGRVDVSGGVLRQTILQVRRVLPQLESGQEVIRTIPSFGYRWNIAVDVETDARDADSATTTDPDPQTFGFVDASRRSSQHHGTAFTRIRHSPLVWAFVAAMVLVVPLTIVRQRQHVGEPTVGVMGDAAPSRCAASESPRDIVAVLPVQGAHGDDGLVWVRFGVMESIVARIGKGGQPVLPSEDVIALTRTMRSDDDTEAVWRAVCARHIVVPSVQRSGTEWVVHLELHDIEGGLRKIEMNHADLVTAAGNASDHVLVMLGREAPADAPAGNVDEALARIHIALVTDDLDAAERLIGNASPDLRASNEFRWKEFDLAFRRGDFDFVRRELDAMLDDPGVLADARIHAKVLVAQASIEVRESQALKAIELLNRAIALGKAGVKPSDLANAYNARGLANVMLGNYDEASADFSSARLAFLSAGRIAFLSMVDANEGLALASQNRPAEAVSLFIQSAERARRFNRIGSLAFTLGFLASAQLDLLQPAEALDVFERYSDVVASRQDSYVWCQYDYHKARALMANGRLQEARHLLDGVNNNSIEYCRNSSLLLGGFAKLDWLEGRAADAVTSARRAVDALTAPSDARERAEAWLTLIRAMHATGADSSVGAELDWFNAWADEFDDAAARIHAHLAVAEHARRSGEPDTATANFEQALVLARRDGVPADISLVAGSYARALLERDDFEAADRVAALVSRWAESDFDSAVLLAAVHQTMGRQRQWRESLLSASRLAGERDIPEALVESASGSRLILSPVGD